MAKNDRTVTVRRPSTMELVADMATQGIRLACTVASLLKGSDVLVRDAPVFAKRVRLAIALKAVTDAGRIATSVLRVKINHQNGSADTVRGITRYSCNIDRVDDEMLAWDAANQIMLIAGSIIALSRRKDRQPSRLGIAVNALYALRPTYTLTTIGAVLYRRHAQQRVVSYLDAARDVGRRFLRH